MVYGIPVCMNMCVSVPTEISSAFSLTFFGLVVLSYAKSFGFDLP